MVKRFFVFTLFLFFSQAFIIPAYGANEFSTAVNATYVLDETGETTVTEGITLKNLTETHFASTFNLTIAASDIREVSAFDGQGPMQVSVEKKDKKSVITAKFNQQIVGKNKEYVWTLRFKSRDFSQSLGRVKRISVPKIANFENLERFSLTLSVPVSFGDPTTILPEPKKTSEIGGNVLLNFDKEQLSNGVMAIFGDNQGLDFKLTANLANTNFLPEVLKLPLPANTDFQQVIISSIDPRPENVVLDRDGNYIALFRLGRRESMAVTVKGQAKLYGVRLDKNSLLSDDEQKLYTASQKYWETGLQLKTRLEEILKGKDVKTNQEKAKLIYDFVSNFLQYDLEGLKSGKLQRLGALTALNNPKLALDNEFTDLFVGLCREAGIPARQLIGYSVGENPDIRPSSFESRVLHSFAEYYDPNLGWSMVDPAWGSTTGGVNNFSKTDLNHFVLTKRGVSSLDPKPSSLIEVKFSDGEFKVRPDIRIEVEAPPEIFAGFPSMLKVRLINLGNYISTSTNFSLSSAKIDISNKKEVVIPELPPFGVLELTFDLRTGALWSSFDDVVQIRVGDQVIEKIITVRPFFSYKYFVPIVFGVSGLMFLIYIITLVIHVFFQKKHKNT